MDEFQPDGAATLLRLGQVVRRNRSELLGTLHRSGHEVKPRVRNRPEISRCRGAVSKTEALPAPNAVRAQRVQASRENQTDSGAARGENGRQRSIRAEPRGREGTSCSANTVETSRRFERSMG